MSAEEPGFWEQPSTIRGLKMALYLGCALALAGSVYAVVAGHPHPHFHWAHIGSVEITELTPGFFALFGFFAYMTIVNTAKVLRTVVMRSEDYYGE